MPFGERHPFLVPDDLPTVESVLKQCIMLLFVHERITADEAERMIAELGLKHA